MNTRPRGDLCQVIVAARLSSRPLLEPILTCVSRRARRPGNAHKPMAGNGDRGKRRPPDARSRRPRRRHQPPYGSAAG
jgi:hypothetical protein